MFSAVSRKKGNDLKTSVSLLSFHSRLILSFSQADVVGAVFTGHETLNLNVPPSEGF